MNAVQRFQGSSSLDLSMMISKNSIKRIKQTRQYMYTELRFVTDQKSKRTIP